MAAGSIIFDLLMRTASFETDTNRAAKLAEKRAKEIKKEFSDISKSIATGFAAVTVAVGGPLLVLDQLVKGIGNFQDISEKTGGAADVFASMAISAGVAGTSVDAVAAASVRLSVGLSKVDDESKGAGKALADIGIELEEFRKLDPATQMDTVAKALAGVEDGADKTAIAVALYGKAGAELLPFLKELGNQSGTQIKLTKEQIAAADEYADSQARLTGELKQFLQIQAAQTIPVLTEVQAIFGELIRSEEFLSSTTAVMETAFKIAIATFQTLAVVGSDVGFVFLSVGREIGSWAAQIGALASGDLQGFRAISDAVREDGERARVELDKFQKRILAIGNAAPMDDEAQRRLGRGVSNKRSVSFSTKDSKESKDKESEFMKYMKQLDQMLQKTQELSNEEKVLAEIRAGRLKVTESEKERLVLLAREVDQTKEAIRIADERAGRRRKDDEDAVEGVRAIEEAERNRLKNLMGNTPSVMLKEQRSDVEFLTQAFEKGVLSEAEYLEAVTERLDLVAEKTSKSKSMAEELGLTFSSAFEDAVAGGKDLGDVIDALAQDLIKLGVRKYLTEPFLEAMNTKTTGPSAGIGGGGGFDFGSIFSGIGSFFGGAFAGGGEPPVGKISMVGERGPELFVPKTAGTILPNNALGKGSVSVSYAPVINIDSRADIAQVKALVDQQVKAGNAKLVSDLNVAGVL
jgi:hypothetical protein